LRYFTAWPWPNAPRHIHVVTHSMGGVVLMDYLQHHSLAQLRQIVMLSPPHHGSPFADLVYYNPLLRLFFGPALAELTTQRLSPTLKHGGYNIGIIAGNFSMDPLSLLLFSDANDGKVAVSSTQIKQMHDFILLPVSHTFMISNTLVKNQVLYFLTHGKFEHLRGWLHIQGFDF
jgi:pimeloyl-ACP methyl ester carboxylesterase